MHVNHKYVTSKAVYMYVYCRSARLFLVRKVGVEVVMVNYIILICLLILSVVGDIKYSKIRNLYVIPAAISGLFINAFEHGIQGLKSSLFGVLVPILLLGILFYLELIGAGDIKLFSAIGALWGCEFILYGMAYSFIFAGIFSLLSLIRNKKSQAEYSTLIKFIKRTFCHFYKNIKMCCLTSSIYIQMSSKKHIIRLSPYIAIGTCLQVILSIF
jgi:prepilin peptidase CpaA